MALNTTSCAAFNTTVVIGDTVKIPGSSIDGVPKISTCVEAGIVGAPAKTPITAALEMKSVLGGLVVPRMLTAQQALMPVGTVPDGTIVYLTDGANFSLRVNNAWVTPGVAAGEIIGPGVSTLNAVATWNNITGTSLQDTNLIYAAGALSGLTSLVNGLGTALLPSYTFTGRLATGMWSNAAGQLNFSTTNGEQFRILDGGVATVNQVEISGSQAGNPLSVAAIGADANISWLLSSKGTGGFNFLTGGGSQLQILNTAVAVNNFAITGSATGTPLVLAAAGTDANIDVTIQSKGTGSLNLNIGAAQALFIKDPGGALVNYFELAPSATGNPLAFVAGGADANIAVELQSKGNLPVFIPNGFNFGLGASFAAADTNTMLIQLGTAPVAGVANATKLYAATAVAAGPINARTIGIFSDVDPVSVVAPTAPDRTLAIVVNGTTYYLAAKTTND